MALIAKTIVRMSQKVLPNEVRRRRKGWCWLFCAAFLAFKVKDSSSKTLVTAILEKLMSLGTSLSTYTANRWKWGFCGIRIHLSKQTAISQQLKETQTRQEKWRTGENLRFDQCIVDSTSLTASKKAAFEDVAVGIDH